MPSGGYIIKITQKKTMKNKRFNELLEKYMTRTASLEEQRELQDWYNSKNNVDVYWQAANVDEEQLLRERLYLNIATRTAAPRSKQQKLWQRISVAAAMLLVVGAGLLLYHYHSNPYGEISYANDVAPGKNSATLTLSNGKQIKITNALNGELANEAGVLISKNRSGELIYQLKDDNAKATNITNTFSTAKGETFQVRLSDGSLIRLNADSKISFSPSFNGSSRRLVSLIGEAYFEIAKDKRHPFILKGKELELEVLGTHFNVSAYDDDAVVKTTLLEGSVKVKAVESPISHLLKPGEQAKLENGKISVAKADIELAVAWKNNEFMFESESIEQIMKMIERWYNVEVIYVGPKPTETFVGVVSRFDNVSKVLSVLQNTGSVKFRIEGRKIYVSK